MFGSSKIAKFVGFSTLKYSYAKDNKIIPGTHEFKAPISKLYKNNFKFENPTLKKVRQTIRNEFSSKTNKKSQILNGFCSFLKPFKIWGFLVKVQILVLRIKTQRVPELI